jgi:hypothetical protein
MENHKVMAWGDNEVGQLGNGMTEKSNEHPTPLVGENGQPLENVEAISASGLGGIALLKGGTVATWGSDQYGALGVGAFESNPSEFCPKGPPCSRKALGVKTLPAVSAVSAIGGTDEVLLPNETVMDWGYNGWGNLGDGTSAQDEHGQLSSDVPVPVCTVSEAIPCKPEHQLHGVVGIAEQQYDSMALLASGNVMMWGANTHGQLGVGNAIRYEDVAIPVPGLSEVTSIAGGGHSGMAIQSRPGPRFYSNGILLGASPHATLSSGTITLENATFGKITCRALANGVVDNELERGRGKVESFLALPCTSVPSCPGVFATAERPLELGETEKGTEKVKVARRGPSSLPWSGEMFTSAETEKTRRLKLERVGLTLVMPCIGGEVFFEGTLEPEYINGSKNGLKPSHLEFGGAAAGQLVSSTGEGLSLGGTPAPFKLAGEMFELTTAE